MSTLKVQLGGEQSHKLTFSEEWDGLAGITYIKVELSGYSTVVSIEDLKAAVKAMDYLVNANLVEFNND